MEKKYTKSDDERNSFFFIVEDDVQKNSRLDVYLSEKLKVSRSFIKQYIRKIVVNQKEEKISYSVKRNDKIECVFDQPEDFSKIIEEYKVLAVVFEDDYFIVVHKEPGIPVHPSFGHAKGTLCNYVKGYLKDKGILMADAGMVHRLDKDTEGLLLFAKSREVQDKLKDLFASRVIKKKYYAIVKGDVAPKKGNFEDYLARSKYDRKKFAVHNENNKGKFAVLSYEVLKAFSNYSFCAIELHTGRTHQIRVQFSSRGYPIVGDAIYSRTAASISKRYGLLLMAYYLEFTHPYTGRQIKVTIPLSDRFNDFLTTYGV